MSGSKKLGMGIVAAILAMTLVAPSARAEGEELAGPNTGNISLSINIDVATEYWFRGIAQENQGAIVQPGIDVGFTLTDWCSAYIGTWNSLHGHQNDDAIDADIWYEADWYGGLTFTFGDFGFDVGYINLYSPAFGGTFAQEIDLTFSYDDSDLLGDWAMAPYVLVAFEFDGGSDNGSNHGTYLEIGFGPSFTIIDSEEYPVTLSVPFTFGFSIDDYYENGNGEDDAFGFFQVGLDFSVPLSFIPAEFGSWSAHAGVNFIFLGDSAGSIGLDFVDDAETVSGFGVTTHDDFSVYGVFGIGFEY